MAGRISKKKVASLNAAAKERRYLLLQAKNVQASRKKISGNSNRTTSLADESLMGYLLRTGDVTGCLSMLFR